MEATAIAPETAARPGQPTNGFDELGGDSFFKLLIAQLANQDPLSPTSNQELLQQISSIRDIELSTSLSNSLRSLTNQQRVGSGAALIGQFVTGAADASGEAAVPMAGVVVGVRFAGDGSAVLLLEGGGELPLDQVESVMPARQAAQNLVGQTVAGLDRSDPANPELAEGVVTVVREDAAGDILLDLDTGVSLALKDVISTASAESLETV